MWPRFHRISIRSERGSVPLTLDYPGTKMPKSDTWPGGIEVEAMTGSCDSFLSVNSGFSDDSMEHLSPEEKACLMFLEETIESLDTEDDSGLSNDESDQLRVPGNLATKMATLTASISKLNSSPIHASKEIIKATSKDPRSIHSYLVPTPLVVANSSTPDKNHIHLNPQFSASHIKPVSHHKQQHSAPPVPAKAKFATQAPPPNTKDHWGQTAEGPSPRGPLSYEALVHLRKSASTKKSPLCPTLDHTIDLATHPPAAAASNYSKHGNLQRSASENPTQVTHRPKTSPPLVAPKPGNISMNPQNGTASQTPDSSGKRLQDPQKVRMEALKKLGLLKDEEPENRANILLPTSNCESSSDLSSKRFVRDPYYANPSRSPSFCYSQVSTEPKGRALQSSASFHCYSRSEQPSAFPSQPHPTNGVKVTPVKHSNARAYSVKVVPGMGADRKEALRKLGLLKDW